MAVTYQSVTTTAWASHGGTITINKPASLAVGDLMIAVIGNDNTTNVSPRTGWSSLAGVPNAITTDGSTNGRRIGLQYKIADASDVAASNFTWTTGDRAVGAIFRISSDETPVIQFNSAEVNNSATPSYANGLTPLTVDSLLLLIGMTRGANAGSGGITSDYAIATDNPTWTERYDTGIDSGADDITFFAATAPRTQQTATGNSSVVFTGSDAADSDSCAYLLAVVESTGDQNLTPDTINAVSAVPTPTLTASATLAPDSVNAVSTVPTPTLNTKNNPWTNTPKSPTPSWTNTPKT